MELAVLIALVVFPVQLCLLLQDIHLDAGRGEIGSLIRLTDFSIADGQTDTRHLIKPQPLKPETNTQRECNVLESVMHARICIE